jgi:hypothetical protein
MKCNCGYEYEEGINENNNGKWETLKGKEKFIKIEGTFFIKKEYDYSPDEIKQINLYACPKCGSVRISDYNL